MRSTPLSRLAPAAALLLILFVDRPAQAQTQTTEKSAPTAADWAALAKLPDFTGVWEIGLGGGGGGRGRGAAPQGPSLTPAAAAKRKELQSLGREDNQTANCVPPGMPGIMGQPYPMEFLLTPGKVTIVIEAYTQVRHIYTDGRPLPEDPDLKFHGTSVGRWEGNALVVDTIGFSPLTDLAANVPHSDKMRIRERFTLTGPDTMSIETTVTDPDVLTAPYTTTRVLQRHRSWTIAEYVCQENNRNFVDEKGKAGIRLDDPSGSPRK